MDSGAGEDADQGAGLGEHRTPRWVKISGIIALIVVLVLAGVLLFGDGEHGPGRHTGAADGVTQGDDRTPIGGGVGHGHGADQTQPWRGAGPPASPSMPEGRHH